MHNLVSSVLAVSALMAAFAVGRYTSDHREGAAVIKELEQEHQLLRQMGDKIAAIEARPACVSTTAALGHLDADSVRAVIQEGVQRALDGQAMERESRAQESEARTPEQIKAFDHASEMLERARSTKIWSENDRLAFNGLTSHMVPSDRDDVMRRASMAINNNELRADALMGAQF